MLDRKTLSMCFCYSSYNPQRFHCTQNKPKPIQAAISVKNEDMLV